MKKQKKTIKENKKYKKGANHQLDGYFKRYEKCWGCYYLEGTPEEELKRKIEGEILTEDFVRKKIVDVLESIKKILLREKSAWEKELNDLESSILWIFRKEKIAETKRVLWIINSLLKILECYIQAYSYHKQNG